MLGGGGWKLDSEIPHSWIGQRVYVGLLVPTKGTSPPSGCFKIGTLHHVTRHGIVGVLANPEIDEDPVRAFYPWTAILSINLESDAARVAGVY